MNILKLVFLILISIPINPTNLFASVEWPNEPAGAPAVFDCPFDGNVCNGIDDYRSLSYVSGAGGPFSPSSALDIYLGVNSLNGSGQFSKTLPNNPREVYVGLWWKTNAEFQGLSNNGNKLFFVSRNGFFFWQGFQDRLGTLKWAQQHVLNNCHVSGWVGGCQPQGSGQQGWYEPNVGSATVSPGSGWHRIELYLKASSGNDSRDGIVRWWLDGTLAGNYTNINQSPQGFDEFIWTNTWDGSITLQCNYRDCSRAWHHYIDHVRISVPNGTAAPIPMPQPQPVPQPQPQPVPTGPSLSSLVIDNTGADIGWSSSADRLTYSSDQVAETTIANPTSGQKGFRHTVSRPEGTTYVCYKLYLGSAGGEPFCKPAQATVATSPQPQPQPQPGTSDQSAPLVSFVYPSDGSNVSNSILAMVQAVDNTAVSEVRLFIDGLQIGSELKAAPYTVLIDTAKLSNGTHQLSAVARDIAGNTSSAAKIALNVSNVAGSYTTDPFTAATGCVMGQTKTNQVNASMGLIWLLPLAGLMRRRRKER